MEAEELKARILNLEVRMQTKDEELKTSRTYGEGKRAEAKQLRGLNLNLDAQV